MGVIVTRSTTSLSGSGGVSSSYTSAEKLAMEMEMEFKAANASYFKELDYDVNDNLTTIDIWTTPLKTLQLFNKTLSYNVSGNLTDTGDNNKIIAKVGGTADNSTATNQLDWDIT